MVKSNIWPGRKLTTIPLPERLHQIAISSKAGIRFKSAGKKKIFIEIKSSDGTVMSGVFEKENIRILLLPILWGDMPEADSKTAQQAVKALHNEGGYYAEESKDV